MPRVTVGVDVGKGTHQAAGYDPAADRVVGRVTFPVSWAGFERFRLFLEQLAPELDDILVGLEATGHYHLTLVEFLAEHGYAVVLINPYQAAQFRRSQGGKAKTDRIDARALARFLAVSAPAATPLSNETLAGLRELTVHWPDSNTLTRSSAIGSLPMPSNSRSPSPSRIGESASVSSSTRPTSRY